MIKNDDGGLGLLVVEAETAKAGCELALEEMAALDRWWPKSKRGSNAQCIFDSIAQRIAGARDCLTDGLKAVK